MLSSSSPKVLSAALLFGICYLLLITNRPSSLYKATRPTELRAFGIDDGTGTKAVFSAGFVTQVMAVTCYVALTIIDLVL